MARKSLEPVFRRIKVKHPFSLQDADPALVKLQQMLKCWASYGPNSSKCDEYKIEYLEATSQRQKVELERTPINYHARRLQDKVMKRY
ncbi:hypothetical protein CANCADRAFT_108122 [Tortispora caseinolytica NRRL Y-17796]|uniref:Uncharacterized protein n=1 Tax=Tortispora caseinolytica NRRL Y-17796 TaxID=767744 RepID=A0A1E4TFP3_9ASCO|nr:hypothetical protein CANCADRAFT_108122 [Tortispora caseinolytica NRRL Y-17796]